MKNKKSLQLAFFLTEIIVLVAFSQCKSMKSEDQGVKGTVTWLEGNHMPTIKSDDQKITTGATNKGTPVKRVIKVYPLTNLSDARMKNGLFQSVDGEPVTEVSSDEEGHYSLILPPGKYSVFTVEIDGLFANKFDGEGNIEPILIRKGEWVQKDIVINYKAYF